MRRFGAVLLGVMLSGCTGTLPRGDGGECPRVEMRFTGESRIFSYGRIGYFDLTNHGPGTVRFDLWTEREVLLFGHPVTVETLRDGKWEPVVVVLDEYAAAPFELALMPGESQRVSVNDPSPEHSAFIGKVGKAPDTFRIRLKDNRFTCTFWSEPFKPLTPAPVVSAADGARVVRM